MKKRIFSLLAVSAVFMLVASGCGIRIRDETCRHVWDSGMVTVAATCSSEGEKKYTCTECRAKKTETIPKNDMHSPVVMPNKAPMCTEPGKGYGVICNACGVILIAQEEIPAVGHKFNRFGSCSKCGIYDANMDDEKNWTANY